MGLSGREIIEKGFLEAMYRYRGQVYDISLIISVLFHSLCTLYGICRVCEIRCSTAALKSCHFAAISSETACGGVREASTFPGLNASVLQPHLTMRTKLSES